MKYLVGLRVSAKVDQVIASGIKVILNNGRRGFIHWRDFGPLWVARIQTNKINNQVYSLKKELYTKQTLHKKLKAESYDLKDLDYLLKVIRYKYYYSKPGEFIYNIQDKKDSN